MIRLFRFSSSRLALLYIVLSGLVLGLFAIPLWYVWRVFGGLCFVAFRAAPDAHPRVVMEHQKEEVAR